MKVPILLFLVSLLSGMDSDFPIVYEFNNETGGIVIRTLKIYDSEIIYKNGDIIPKIVNRETVFSKPDELEWNPDVWKNHYDNNKYDFDSKDGVISTIFGNNKDPVWLISLGNKVYAVKVWQQFNATSNGVQFVPNGFSLGPIVGVIDRETNAGGPRISWQIKDKYKDWEMGMVTLFCAQISGMPTVNQVKDDIQKFNNRE